MSFKKFKEVESEKKGYFKDKRERERDFANDVLAKLSMDPKDLKNTIPLPVDYDTFERLNVTYSKNKGTASQKKTMGFGVGSRIPLSEKEKWVNKVQKYNSRSDKAIDPKNDPQPGPPAYSLVCHWAGKKPRKEKEADKIEKSNFLKHISRGPIISPYYSKYD